MGGRADSSIFMNKSFSSVSCNYKEMSYICGVLNIIVEEVENQEILVRYIYIQ